MRSQFFVPFFLLPLSIFATPIPQSDGLDTILASRDLASPSVLDHAPIERRGFFKDIGETGGKEPDGTYDPPDYSDVTDPDFGRDGVDLDWSDVTR